MKKSRFNEKTGKWERLYAVVREHGGEKLRAPSRWAESVEA